MERRIENGRVIVSYTSEELRAMPDLTDWERVRNMSDEEATQNALDDPDNPPLGDDFFKNAKRMRLQDLVMPKPKKSVSLRLDQDVLAWLKSQGKGYQTRVNAILRAFMEAHDGR